MLIADVMLQTDYRFTEARPLSYVRCSRSSDSITREVGLVFLRGQGISNLEARIKITALPETVTERFRVQKDLDQVMNNIFVSRL